MQTVPTNALNSSFLVLDSNVAVGSQTASACGYQCDFTGGSGNVWGTSSDSKTVLP